MDWGLGHATRCIPLIHELLQQNCRVVLAASGTGKTLLQQEFPHLEILDIPGYEIEYAATGWGLAVKIVAQIPKLLSAIETEQEWLEKLVNERVITAVISDNRYGLHHPQVRSVFMTHQLRIQAPVKLAEELLQDINFRYIQHFDECWVPDAAGEENLAGNLSHPAEKPELPLHYIGPLSRFTEQPELSGGAYLLLLLSGPEPQRTLLEERLLQELESYTGPVVLVRGLPDATEKLSVAENITVYDHLPAAELEGIILGASLVIARCGYSTVMDLAALKKRSILIPTPGQTEQEYLAGHLMKANFAFCVEQKKISLKKVLPLAARFHYQPFVTQGENSLSKAVKRFAASLHSPLATKQTT
jgi:UDP-N-acetylglucosamine transferase subunit ALG13